ncbi:hypothetical protein [Streptomyces sp. RerS4]|uniref:hypothetical protein n=1 Tax=Streptomyces sp. RerS4 TaxID=2942449 RepID=UPI00201C8A8D|nr:hypothetical protein [Streptomyces sp. RerS4]UQX03429.1 hypothetical protein M4D82_25295 [Streptomyces sp. RerS4]
MENLNAEWIAMGRCVGVRCANSRTPSTHGSRLCRSCRQRLAEDLALLPELYSACEQVLGGASRLPGHQKTTGGNARNMPFNTDAADVRADILAVLGAWTSLVVEERPAAAPPRDVAARSAFLARHVAWLSAHAAVGEATAELAALVRRARRLSGGDTWHRVRVGACVREGCAGELTATLPAPGSALVPQVWCSLDEAHRWQTREWTRLGQRRDEGPAERWLKAPDISRLWDTPLGSVYRLAGEHRWRRREDTRGKVYHAEDVERTFAQRAAKQRRGATASTPVIATTA